MAIKNVSDDVLVITLPKEPHLSDDLEAAALSARSRTGCRVIVDFSSVEILPSITICSLMILKGHLGASGGKLVLVAVPPSIAAVFRRVGLHGLFQFADNAKNAKWLLDDATRASSQPI